MLRKRFGVMMSSMLLTSMLLSNLAHASSILLKQGSRGNEVTKVQQQLQSLGFFKYPRITGYYGSITSDAVKQFQKSKSLVVDGIVGKNTYSAIFNSNTSSSPQAAPVTLRSYSTTATLLLKQGSRGDEVIKVQKQLQALGFFKHPSITGYYGSITSDAVKQFQKSKGLSVDGIVGKNTYSAMFNSNTSSSSEAAVTTSRSAATSVREVQLLDWWTKASSAFPRGAVATIVDVDTKKRFQVKRTYGTNHADVEPLTANDSKIIKQIWGGWSWSRRAIIVQINGQNIAASMAAMPHAGLDNQPANVSVSGRSGGYGYGTNLDSVKGNGADGHMDIHFLNSRTHGTNRVDAAHQSMVKKAANSY